MFKILNQCEVSNSLNEGPKTVERTPLQIYEKDLLLRQLERIKGTLLNVVVFFPCWEKERQLRIRDPLPRRGKFRRACRKKQVPTAPGAALCGKKYCGGNQCLGT
ncbi:unnamed protein product [Larinioides sclopetarius]|uniref:Uncharacterized protein n=1 Tax=Larinioides sclopetarius TaxID=280406 RepID=A0AAV1Z8C8_9ARAC